MQQYLELFYDWFLGTVLGMIRAFYDMANAGGILVFQCFLMVFTLQCNNRGIAGVVAYLGYNLLVAKVNKVVNKLELRATEFMDLLNEPIE